MDPRFEQFADILTGYCTNVQPGEVVMIEAWEGVPIEMVVALCFLVNSFASPAQVFSSLNQGEGVSSGSARDTLAVLCDMPQEFVGHDSSTHLVESD